MKLIVDTNIFLDVILQREYLWYASARILDSACTAQHHVLMPAHSAGTIIYIVQKNKDRDTAISALRYCLSVAHVAYIDESTVLSGLELDLHDIEDSFVAAIASREHADFIITRNTKDFRFSPIPALSPEGFFALVE
ncbi:toxin PIN [Galliscardovia ingluviei]|uniref:Toxin PIN n=1 Tax=Galliscardovia ingluviei TaxID=1769422 RepID=A0A8J3AHK6_9BIFI|nr:PIN domain-containing protein [Galliscardovia ingluviei]GGI14607.1 toxin PIN [Galliscardovia ingluviei]